MSNSNREELQVFSKIVKATQGADFGPALQSSLSRRRFFIAGGATLAFAITLFLPLSEMFKALAR